MLRKKNKIQKAIAEEGGLACQRDVDANAKASADAEKEEAHVMGY